MAERTDKDNRPDGNVHVESSAEVDVNSLTEELLESDVDGRSIQAVLAYYNQVVGRHNPYPPEQWNPIAPWLDSVEFNIGRIANKIKKNRKPTPVIEAEFDERVQDIIRIIGLIKAAQARATVPPVDMDWPRRNVDVPPAPPGDGAINTEPDAPEALDNAPRTPFERFLLSQGFPKELLTQPTEAAWQKKVAFFFTHLFKLVDNDQNWVNRNIPNPTKFSFAVGGLSYSPLDLTQTLTQFVVDVTPAEREIAERIQLTFRDQMGALDALFGGFEDYHSKSFSPQGLLERYDPSKRRLPSEFDEWFFLTLDTLPALVLDMHNPDLPQDEYTLGKRMLIAFQEILQRGYVWEREQPTALPRKQTTQIVPKAADRRNILARVRYWTENGVKVDFKRLRQFVVRSAKEGNMFPYESSNDTEGGKTVWDAFLELRKAASKRADGTIPAEPSLAGKIAAGAAALLAETTLEASRLDNKNNRPLGVQAAGRIMNADAYALKLVERPRTIEADGEGLSSQEGAQNPYLVGGVHSFFLPFFEFICYDGKNGQQHLLEAKRWHRDQQHPEQGGLDFSKMNKNQTYEWCMSLVRGIELYNIANGGMEVGDITGIAELNLKERTIKINKKVVDSMLRLHRVMMSYHLDDDMADISPTSLKQRGNRENLSEDFVTVEVVDTITKRIASKTTRLYHQYPVSTETDLARWVQGAEIDRDRGINGIEKITAVRPSDGKETRTIRVYIKGKLDINTPGHLMRRLLMSRYLLFMSLPTDVPRRMNKEDYMVLGIFFSADIRAKYLKGKMQGPLEALLTKLGDALHLNFLQVEDPGIIGADLWNEEQFYEVLSMIGVELTYKDWQAFVKALTDTFGIKTT